MACFDARTADAPIQDGPLHHAIWTDLQELYRLFQRRIVALERQLASDLVHIKGLTKLGNLDLSFTQVTRQNSARPSGTTNRVITELILDYLTFANTIYVKDGKKTGPSSGKAMISRDQGQTWEAVEDHRVGVLPVRSCRPSSFSRSRFDVPEHAADHHQVFRLGGPIGIGCQKVVR